MSRRDKAYAELLRAHGWTSARARQSAELAGLVKVLPPPVGYVVKKGRKALKRKNAMQM